MANYSGLFSDEPLKYRGLLKDESSSNADDFLNQVDVSKRIPEADKLITPQQEKSFLENLINKIKESASSAVSQTKDYIFKTSTSQKIEDTKEVGDAILKGASTGLKLVGQSVKNILSLADRLMMGASFSEDIVKASQEQKGLSSEQIGEGYKKILEEEKKTKESYKGNKVAEFVYDTSKFVAPSLIPVPFGKEGLLKAGLVFVKDTQLLYNPAEHEGKDELKARVDSAVENFLTGAAFYGAEKYIAKPLMKKLWEAVTYPIRILGEEKKMQISRTVAENYLGSLMGMAREQEEKQIATPLSQTLLGFNSDNFILSDDILGALKGTKPITPKVKRFFASEGWQEVIKKYGVDEANYPKIISLVDEGLKTKEAITTPVGSARIEPKALIGSNPLFDELKNVFIKNVDEYSNPAEIFNKTLKGETLSQDLKEVVEKLEKNGYKVDKQKLLDVLANTVQYKREFEGWSLMAVEQEMANQQAKFLEPYMKSLRQYQKLYNLLYEKSGGDIVKVGEAYNKWARKAGAEPLDAIAENLRDLGFDIPVGSFEESLIEIINSIDAVKSIPKPPKEYNFEKELLKAVTPAIKQIETPFQVGKKELSSDVLASLNIEKKLAEGNVDEAKTLVDKIKDKVLREQTKQDVVASSSNIKDFLDNAKSKDGIGVAVGKMSVNQADAVFGKTENPNKLNETIINFRKSVSDNKTPPSESINLFNDYLKEELKTTIYDSSSFDNAYKETSPLRNLLASISAFVAPSNYIKLFKTPQGDIVLNQTYRWAKIQENVNDVFKKFLGFIKENNFLSEKINDIQKVLTENPNAVFDNNFIPKNFTPEEWGIVKEYVKSAKSLLETINIFRVATGKEPIPDLPDYVAPRKLAEPILQALFENNLINLRETDVKFYIKRQLEEVGYGGIFSDNLLDVWQSYVRVAKRLISRYNYEFLTEQAGIGKNSKIDIVARDLLSRWEEAIKLRPKDSTSTYFDNIKYEADKVARGFARFIEEKIFRKENVLKIPISEQMLKEAQKSETLMKYVFNEETIKRGYLELDKKFVDNIAKQTENPDFFKTVIYVSSLGLNTTFTVVNSLQNIATTLPYTGHKNLIQSYIETVLNPVLRFFSLGYDKQRIKELGAFAQLLGKGQTVFADERYFANNLVKALTFNISLVEEEWVRPVSVRSFENMISRWNLPQEVKERMAVEFAKDVNYIGGRVFKPPLAKVPIVSWIYTLGTYPMEYLFSVISSLKVAISDKEAVRYFSNLASRATVNKEELATVAKEVLSSRNPSLWGKAARVMPIMTATAGFIYASYYLGQKLFDAAFFLSEKLGLNKEPITPVDKEEYEKTRSAFARSFQERLSPVETVKGMPPVKMINLFYQYINKGQITEGSIVDSFVKAGLSLIFNSPQVALYILQGKTDEADTLANDMLKDVIDLSNNVLIGRTFDAISAYEKGVLMSKTREGRIQYRLAEGENPLSVFLFGRGMTKGYRELQEIRKQTDERSSLRNKAWDYYERYLETGNEKYYNFFKDINEKLYENYGERISLFDLIERRKQFTKGTTSPERLLKTQPKEAKPLIQQEVEKNVGAEYLQSLFNLK